MGIIILGAGLAGSVAYGALSDYDPVIYEAKPKADSGLNNHHAVMRIRDLDVAKYLGCDAKPIRIRKQVYEGANNIYDVCSIRSNNHYSQKLYGELGVRSIMSLGWDDRYLINFSPSNNAVYGQKVNRVRVDNSERMPRSIGFDGSKKGKRYEWCISTLPMPVMLRLCGIPIPAGIEFKTEPIAVSLTRLSIESDIHQTIYFPDPDNDVYRITIEGKRVIVESIGLSEEDLCTDRHLDLIENIKMLLDMAFGLTPKHYGKWSAKIMPNGKMLSIDEDFRKYAITKLTEDYNILSFGRHAIWKPIRADHLVQDVERIKKIIHSSESARKYDSILKR